MEDEAVIKVGEVISQGLSMAPVGMAVGVVESSVLATRQDWDSESRSLVPATLWGTNSSRCGW